MKSFKKNYPRVAKGLKYAGNAIQVASKAYSMAKVVAAIVNAEKKYFDVNTADAGCDTTAQITCLTNMAQGDTNITRDGNTVALKSLQIEGYVNFDTAVPYESVRIMLIRDNDNLGGTAPTVTDVLESSNVMALRNKNTPKRFTVLMDRFMTCDKDHLGKRYSYYHKFGMMKDKQGNPTRSHHLYFDGVNAADYTRGHLFLIVLGNTATAGTLSSHGWNSRIRFYDN